MSGKDADRFDREIRCWARILRRDFPPSLPVIVRIHPRRSIVDDDGERCFAYWKISQSGKRWLIDLERSPDVTRSIDDLWHEWAHILAPPQVDAVPHPNRWWKVYRQIVRRYQGR